MELSFIVKFAKEVEITLLGPGGTVLLQPSLVPVNPTDEESLIAIYPMLDNVVEIVIKVTAGDGYEAYEISNLFILMCCGPAGPPPPPTTTPTLPPTPGPTTTPHVCPDDSAVVSSDEENDNFNIEVVGPSEGDINPNDVFDDLPVLTKDDFVLVKTECPASTTLVMEVTFTVQYVESLTLKFLAPGGAVLDSILVTPSDSSVAQTITVYPMLEDVSQIIFTPTLQMAPDQEFYVLGNLVIVMCCVPGTPQPSTVTQCPEGEELVTSDEGQLTVNIELPDGSGYETPSDIFEDEPVELPIDSTIFITDLCPYGETTVMSLSFTVENAASVEVVISGESGILATFPMIVNNGSPTLVSIPAMISGATQIVITVEPAEDETTFKISDLRLVFCCGPEVVTVTPTTPGECVFDMEAYIEQFGSAPDNEDIIGYIEKDNVPGLSSPDEIVSIGDVIEPGAVVHIDCNNCTCDEDSGISCTNADCETDCVWTQWSPWENCTEACDGGVRFRTRGFIPGSPNGEPCEGDTTESECCNIDPCPVDCTFNQWNQWSECSADCGAGYRFRTRSSNPEQFGGQPCDGSPLETERCVKQDCELPCATNMETSDTCEVKSCLDRQFPDAAVESDEPCSSQCQCKYSYADDGNGECVSKYSCPCFVIKDDGTLENHMSGSSWTSPDTCEQCTCTSGQAVCEPLQTCACIYSEWSQWSDCCATCGPGEQFRFRSVLAGTDGDCTEVVQVQNCFVQPCDEVTCVVDGVEYPVTATISETLCEICICNVDGNEECQPKEYSNVVDECTTEICVDGELLTNDTSQYCAPCQEGYERVPTEDDCCHCEPSNECQLSTRYEVLTVMRPNGEECVSLGQIPITYCEGACPSFDSSPVYFYDANTNQATLAERDAECKCCTGQGDLVTQTVYCGDNDEALDVHIQQFDHCVCQECAAKKK
jgi:hypothetical protein